MAPARARAEGKGGTRGGGGGGGDAARRKRPRGAGGDDPRHGKRAGKGQDRDADPELAARTAKYERAGPYVPLKKVKNKRVREGIRANLDAGREAAESAARAEILLTDQGGYLEAENDVERTFKVTQKDVSKMADANTRQKMLDLELTDSAPYRVSWTQNGRHLAMGGSKGHLSVLDALRIKPLCEVQVGETVRDVTFLHNHTFFAAAQRKHIFIYDEKGVEVHRLRSHVRSSRLQFLPYHFLLASVGHGGWLKYQDTSTGELVSEHRTKLGPCDVMAQNPANAIICLGHGNGTVTMWSPSSPQPLVKMLCHNGAVRAVAVSRRGTELVTAGLDGRMSVWDVRTYKRLHSYYNRRPATSLDVSQTGLLAVTSGYQVQVWKDALRTKQDAPYMQHQLPGQEFLDCKWRPYEDVLGLGHTAGVQTMVVPGAGAANYDAFEANPYESTKQRREGEVQRLLDKLQPEMIVLDPNAIGGVDTADKTIIAKEREQELAEAAAAKGGPKERNKMKGRSKIGAKLKRKHRNIITAERAAAIEEVERVREEQRNSKKDREAAQADMNPVFKRFAKKPVN
ncbi:WD repeat-containing protein 46 [Hondaea fermentalgiana]|uniref:WD repeat-containing protein 46 n=1 Tax=Hondaea fermentalgiana TaxID=2315210 RepID=A0A2R5FZI2_9STRA|nr:WD repeat-containing protein 46 [Hondaea fermentalgiana]|eukprot:GBG24162.1 WD repeat-containing protein 46 [Hondaea fermentalgiana]